MAGIKPEAVTRFYRRLRERGETASSLARQLGLTNHSYVSRLVNGHGRRRGSAWWPRLRALLTEDELALIAPAERLHYPTLRAAVAALPDATTLSEPQQQHTSSDDAGEAAGCAVASRGERDPATVAAVAEFTRWKERRSA